MWGVFNSIAAAASSCQWAQSEVNILLSGKHLTRFLLQLPAANGHQPRSGMKALDVVLNKPCFLTLEKITITALGFGWKSDSVFLNQERQEY